MRKIIQHTVSTAPSEDFVYVLCDDGKMFTMSTRRQKWQELPPIPQDEVEGDIKLNGAWDIDDRIVHVKTNEKDRVIDLLYTTSELRIEWDTGRISDIDPSLVRIAKGKDV